MPVKTQYMKPELIQGDNSYIVQTFWCLEMSSFLSFQKYSNTQQGRSKTRNLQVAFLILSSDAIYILLHVFVLLSFQNQARTVVLPIGSLKH